MTFRKVENESPYYPDIKYNSGEITVKNVTGPKMFNIIFIIFISEQDG